MYKQLVKDIIKAGNKAMDSVPVTYTVDTKYNRYYSHNRLYYDDNHVEFVDEYDDDINLSYEDINGISIDLKLRSMIKLNSDKGREIISDYITALNGDSESIKWANDKRKAEYDTYDDELKASVDDCFDCI